MPSLSPQMLLPILPYLLYGNIELFQIGKDGGVLFWPLSWALSPSGDPHIRAFR